MKDRILAFVILWTLLVILPLVFGQWGVFALILLFGIGTQVEFIGLLRKMQLPVEKRVAIPGLVALLAGFILLPPWIAPPMAVLGLVFSGIVVATLLRGEVGQISNSLVYTLATVILIGLPMVCAILLQHEFDAGILLLLWVIAVAKFTDVGALLVGTYMGKHRMAPTLSPKKSWEGLAGGLAAAVFISVMFVLVFRGSLPAGLTVWHAAWMAIPLALAGVLADLLESAFKREAGVKDSGRIIPGIGGFFDLTDSALLAFPVGYFLIWLVV